MSTKDFSNTTRLRRKMAEIYSAYYNNSLNATTAPSRQEQTSAMSGEVVALRQRGCAPCIADNLTSAQLGGLTIPYNERNPGGR